MSDLRALVAVVVVLVAAAWGAYESRTAAYLLAAALFLLFVRGLFYVLGAKAAMADPDERQAKR